jgi:ABC-2 type transport system permease protein
MNLRRVLALTLKEWREIVRDPVYLTLAFVIPVVLMVVVGHGITQDVDNVGLIVLDEDRTTTSRAYLQNFVSTRHFRLAGRAQGLKEAEAMFLRGGSRVVLWIGPGFERDLVGGRPAHVQAIVDGTFTVTARTIRAYLEAINARAAGAIVVPMLARRLQLPEARVADLVQPLRLRVRFLYNPAVRSNHAVAPPLMMLVLLLVPPLLTAVSVVREKETGALYNIASSTVTRLEFLVGKLAPAVGVSIVDAVLLWLIARFYFGAPFHGSAWQFALATVLYVVATSALGLLVSIATRTQQAAIMIATMTAFIVAFQFAGMFTPLESMSGVGAVIARLFPASYYDTIVMGSFLKAVGIGALWPEYLALALYGLVVLGLAHALFRKRVRS